MELFDFLKTTSLYAFQVCGFEIHFTSLALSMFISVFFIIIALGTYVFPTKKTTVSKDDFKSSAALKEWEKRKMRKFIPNYPQIMCEAMYEFVEEIAKGTVGEEDTKKFISIGITLFTFILFCNALGIFHSISPVTSNFLINSYISVFLFISTTAVGMFRNGLKFGRLFLPKNVPLLLAPLLFLIEFFTYFTRPITLALRLAANVIAGHIITGVAVNVVASADTALKILPFSGVILLNGFEIFVAVLQAYIFTMLSFVYLGTVKNADH
ncbi:ATP synthase subunit a [Candidatus Fokinia solitaria]|uniref:ATP synthase subunit a n=1 Tax=Candidatus Fokinia solitaria TaxID=1802984 RepID=A0A2U8BSP4_9RICK|nr:F0F1 ATP synthase subunit A [Candidatus Fokinia solitaria]AWD33357.1 ATP synthase subunit a [Candidatus Fokinia solitaria]